MAFEVIISDEVFAALNAIILYLENKWTKRVAENFLHTFYKKVDAIASTPNIGRQSTKDPSIRTVSISKHNLLYYQIKGNRIELLTIFFTQQNPEKNQFD